MKCELACLPRMHRVCRTVAVCVEINCILMCAVLESIFTHLTPSLNGGRYCFDPNAVLIFCVLGCYDVFATLITVSIMLLAALGYPGERERTGYARAAHSTTTTTHTHTHAIGGSCISALQAQESALCTAAETSLAFCRAPATSGHFWDSSIHNPFLHPFHPP